MSTITGGKDRCFSGFTNLQVGGIGNPVHKKGLSLSDIVAFDKMILENLSIYVFKGFHHRVFPE